MDKTKTTLKLNFDEALRNYKKILQKVPNVFTASDEEMDGYFDSVFLAKAEVDKAFDEALNYKGD